MRSDVADELLQSGDPVVVFVTYLSTACVRVLAGAGSLAGCALTTHFCLLVVSSAPAALLLPAAAASPFCPFALGVTVLVVVDASAGERDP